MSAVVRARVGGMLEELVESGQESGLRVAAGETVRPITGLTPAEALRTYATEPPGVSDERGGHRGPAAGRRDQIRRHRAERVLRRPERIR